MQPAREPGTPTNDTNEPQPLWVQRPLGRRKFLKYTAGGLIGATLAGSAGWGYARHIEPDWVELTPVSMALPRLALPFQQYLLVQLSDIHLGDWLVADQLHDL